MDSPDKEWRRLTEHYAGMYDEELIGLARDYRDLTEMAQQALRDEMRKRGLVDPTAPRAASQRVSGFASQQSPVPPIAQDPSPRSGARADGTRTEACEPAPRDPRAEVDRMRFAAHYATLGDEDLLDLADDLESLTEGARLALKDELKKRGLDEDEELKVDALERAEARARGPENSATVERKSYDLFAGPITGPDVIADAPEAAGSADDGPHEYTWKTVLCTCDELAEARQLREALRRAEIESWVEDMAGYGIGVGSPRVLVPADRLEEAQAIAAQPIPQDIIEDSKIEVPEYEMPRCPKCRAADPVLIDTEPANKWLCESCGNEWTEASTADAEK